MKILLYTAVFFASSLLCGQDIKGFASYRTSQDVEMKIDTTNMNDVTAMAVLAQIKKEFDKAQILKFNSKASLYEEVEELQVARPQLLSAARITMAGTGSSAPLYRNTAEKTVVRQEELMGKKFLVKGSLRAPEWKIQPEQKEIGNYTCQKATWTRTEKQTQWNPEKKDFVDSNVEVTTVAWYAPGIPVSHGPHEYWGLPGLILEVHEGKKSYLCTGITLNPDIEFLIEAPTKGKEINPEAFEKLRRAKNKEMFEKFGGGREGSSIKIGG